MKVTKGKLVFRQLSDQWNDGVFAFDVPEERELIGSDTFQALDSLISQCADKGIGPGLDEVN